MTKKISHTTNENALTMWEKQEDQVVTKSAVPSMADSPFSARIADQSGPLLTAKEVCVMLRMIDLESGKPQIGTLANWRYLGRGPAYVRLGETKGGPVRYHVSAVLEWLHDHTHRSTSEE